MKKLPIPIEKAIATGVLRPLTSTYSFAEQAMIEKEEQRLIDCGADYEIILAGKPNKRSGWQVWLPKSAFASAKDTETKPPRPGST